MDTNQSTPGMSGGTQGANMNQKASSIHDKIDAARPAVDRAMESAHEKVDQLADMAGQASQTLEQKAAEFKEMQAKFMENATTYVQSHPMASLGIAMAAGFLLSKMMSSSNTQSHNQQSGY